MFSPKVCKTCNKIYSCEKDFLTSTSQWRLCSMQNLWFSCECGSTLMLPKGRYPWYQATMGMSEQTTGLFNQLSNKDGLPHIPAAIMEILTILEDKDANINDLKNSLKKDPVLMAEMLNISNQLRFIRQGPGSSPPISDVSHAIAYIGRKQLKDITISAQIKQFRLKTKVFSQAIFWKDSLVVALVTEGLAQFFPKSKSYEESLYLMGYLANIGKLISAFIDPEKTDIIYAQTIDSKNPISWKDAERNITGYDHCILGEIGAIFWGFPEQVVEAARYHHLGPGKKTEELYLVCLANNISCMLLSNFHKINKPELEEVKSHFSISDEKLQEMCEILKVQLKL